MKYKDLKVGQFFKWWDSTNRDPLLQRAPGGYAIARRRPVNKTSIGFPESSETEVYLFTEEGVKL